MFDELSAKWETDLDFKGASDMFDSLTGIGATIVTDV